MDVLADKHSIKNEQKSQIPKEMTFLFCLNLREEYLLNFCQGKFYPGIIQG